MGIYNGVWEHLYRRYITGEVDVIEERPLFVNNDDVNVLKPAPGTRGYTETNKGSVDG
jgi:hypothetical protein